MQPTLAQVLALPALGLRQVAGGDDLGDAVRWVAVSELTDPTPYLEGGEILLTTGMNLPADDATALAGYVERIARRGVVALGLAVGLTHPQMPPALQDAADAAGLPLFEVPPPTPFIAVTRAVADLVAQAEREAVQRSLDAQRRLTRAALRPDGVRAVVRELARLLDGWALVVDARGGAVHGSSPAAERHAEQVAAEVRRIRPRGLRATASVAAGDETVAIYPLGTAGRPRWYLAAAGRQGVDPAARSAVTAAVSLLSLTHERAGAGADLERRLRREVTGLLLAGLVEAADAVRSVLGTPRMDDAPLVVLAAEPVGDVGPALADAEDDEDLAGCHLGAADGQLVVVTPGDADTVEAAASSLVRLGCRVGMSRPVATTAAAEGFREARQALRAAGRAGQPLGRFESLVGEGLPALVDPAAARGWADAALAPLRAYSEDGGKVDLVASLRTYLAHHGQWLPAAQDLGVHRHTLRYRIGRVEQLLGVSLDSPQTRMNLWFALQSSPSPPR